MNSKLNFKFQNSNFSDDPDAFLTTCTRYSGRYSVPEPGTRRGHRVLGEARGATSKSILYSLPGIYSVGLGSTTYHLASSAGHFPFPSFLDDLCPTKRPRSAASHMLPGMYNMYSMVCLRRDFVSNTAVHNKDLTTWTHRACPHLI